MMTGLLREDLGRVAPGQRQRPPERTPPGTRHPTPDTRHSTLGQDTARGPAPAAAAPRTLNIFGGLTLSALFTTGFSPNREENQR
jgi:hypothetical protein